MNYPEIGWCPVCKAPRHDIGTGSCDVCFNHLMVICPTDEVFGQRAALEEIARYFKSCNEIPVERAVIKGVDFWKILEDNDVNIKR